MYITCTCQGATANTVHVHNMYARFRLRATSGTLTYSQLLESGSCEATHVTRVTCTVESLTTHVSLAGYIHLSNPSSFDRKCLENGVVE